MADHLPACPYCRRSVKHPAAKSCGSFSCLYQRFCGSLPPVGSHPRRPFPWRDPGEVGEIAVIRPGQIGDLLLATPGLRALKRGFPVAKITLLAQPWAVQLSGRFAFIDRVLPLQAARAESGVRYDLALQLQGDDPSAARFALGLGARATAGFCRDDEIGKHFHLLVTMLPDEPEVFRVLRLADALGARPHGVELEFNLLPQDTAEIESIDGLQEAWGLRPVVVLHPGARAPARRWPLERFAELAAALHERWKATLIMVGGEEEIPLVEKARAESGVAALNLAGRLSLGGLAALLRSADLFVGNDSGPAQLAAAVASRSLRIFGPANRHRWAPLDHANHRIVFQEAECSPCGHWECPTDHRCLRRVTVEDVLAEVDRLLRRMRQ